MNLRRISLALAAFCACPLSALASEAGHSSAGFSMWAWPDKAGDPVGLGYMIINFLVLLFILNKIVFKPLRTKHEARSERIKDELSRATSAREEAQRLLVKSKERYEAIEKESDEILEKARVRAEDTRRTLIEKAEKDAQSIRDGARQFAERDAARVKAEIEAEVAARAVEQAEAKIRESFEAQDQSRLVDAYIREVGELQLQGQNNARKARA